MSIAIWWIRRDLRLADNQALAAALASSEQILPVFIVDPALLTSPWVGSKRLAFLWEGLRHLDAALQQRGSRLLVRRGPPLATLTTLWRESGAEAIFAEENISPYARRRDAAVAAHLPLTLLPGLTVHHPADVLKADGAPYTVFTPFSRAWKALPLPQRSDLLPTPPRISTPTDIPSDPIPADPALSPDVPFPPSEAEAQRRLARFTSGDDAPIFAYGDLRNRMDVDGVSQLSPYLRFGMLSPRQATVAALGAMTSARDEERRKSAETWLNELIWREFYQAILYHFPHVRTRSFRPEYDRIAWRNDEAEFAAWCEGRTGYPVVDAAMRQLTHTGWMHNRARMIVASFLVKDLLIDWRWGERWFMQHLVDGDPAANNGGWQWTAGVGVDAAPYFRIFNPVAQGQKFDPEGDYVRRWIPELTDGIYPAPLVDHAAARIRTLEAYDRAKSAVD